MKYYPEFQYDVDGELITKQLKEFPKKPSKPYSKELLNQIFGFIDLTSLSEKDNAENIGRMCDQVNMLTESYPDMPAPAAICVYPELVQIVRAKLTNPLVNIASVGAGFPSSQTFIEIKLREVEMALEAGADEIDVVLPVGKFQLGLDEEVFEEIKMIKEKMGTLHLKVILETASLTSLNEVRKASLLAMDAGADFIKTSTGKSSGGAEPESFLVMCQAIMDFYSKTGKKIGIKPAGGISSVSDAYTYYTIVKSVLGDDWLDTERFRIGASRLANQLIRELYGKDDTFSYFY